MTISPRQPECFRDTYVQAGTIVFVRFLLLGFRVTSCTGCHSLSCNRSSKCVHPCVRTITFETWPLIYTIWIKFKGQGHNWSLRSQEQYVAQVREGFFVIDSAPLTRHHSKNMSRVFRSSNRCFPFMVALWNRADHYIFILWFLLLLLLLLLLSFFFPRLNQPSQIECLPYLHTWCSLSANLRRRPETCCTRLAENTGRKKSSKICHLGKSHKLSGYIFATKTVVTCAIYCMQQIAHVTTV